MFGPIVVSGEKFEHQIDCFYNDASHTSVLTINRGDIIEVTNERKYTKDNGWYALVKHNNQCMFYIAFKDLERYMKKDWLLTILDIDLKINYLGFKINQSLETGDKASFIHFTSQLKEINDLKGIMEQYVSNEYE